MEAHDAGAAFDAPSACVLLGLRKPHHVEAAARAGDPLSPADAEWVRGL